MIPSIDQGRWRFDNDSTSWCPGRKQFNILLHKAQHQMRYSSGSLHHLDCHISSANFPWTRGSWFNAWYLATMLVIPRAFSSRFLVFYFLRYLSPPRSVLKADSGRIWIFADFLILGDYCEFWLKELGFCKFVKRFCECIAIGAFFRMVWPKTVRGDIDWVFFLRWSRHNCKTIRYVEVHQLPFQTFQRKKRRCRD